MDQSGSISNFPPWCHLCFRRNTCETAHNFTTSQKLNISKVVIGWCSVCFFLVVFLVTFQIKPHQNSSTKKEILSYSAVIPWRLSVLFSQSYLIKFGWEEVSYKWEKPDRERWFFLPKFHPISTTWSHPVVPTLSPYRCINALSTGWWACLCADVLTLSAQRQEETGKSLSILKPTYSYV